MANTSPIYTRRTPILDRRLAESTLRKLIAIIDEEFEASRAAQKYASMSLQIAYFDQTSYELENAAPETTDDAFGKSVRSMTVRAALIDDRRIVLELDHGDMSTPSHNVLTISGRDRTWVDGMTGRLMDVIKGAPRQPRTRAWALAVSIAIAIAWAFLGATLLRSAFKIGDFSWQVLVMLASLFFVPCSLVVDRIFTAMWPRVELQTGPSHAHGAARLRNRIWLLITLFLFPIVTAYLPTFVPPSSLVATTADTSKQVIESGKVVPKANPLEIAAILERSTVQPGAPLVVTVRLRNLGTQPFSEVEIFAFAPGFTISDRFQVLRWITPGQEQSRKFTLTVEQGVPKGKHDMRIEAVARTSPNERVDASTTVSFGVD